MERLLGCTIEEAIANTKARRDAELRNYVVKDYVNLFPDRDRTGMRKCMIDHHWIEITCQADLEIVCRRDDIDFDAATVDYEITDVKPDLGKKYLYARVCVDDTDHVELSYIDFGFRHEHKYITQVDGYESTYLDYIAAGDIFVLKRGSVIIKSANKK